MQPSDIFDPIVGFFSHLAHNFHRNLFHMFDDMNTTRYIRLIACAGAYFLLRPYLVKLGERIQGKQLEKLSSTPSDPYDAAIKEKGGREKLVTPNSLRGASGKTVSFADDGEGEAEGEGTGANWGKKARERQRKVVGRLAEQRERVLREDDEGNEKDLMELLVDYQEGEDGW